MQYTLTLKTNIPAMKEMEGETPFPDRRAVGTAMAATAAILLDQKFEQIEVIPFNIEGEDVHVRFVKGDEFAEIEVHPRGEEVLASKELDDLFQKLETHLTGTGVEEVVLGAISDVYKGVFSRKEPLIPPLTVGEVRAIKGWWRTKWIVSEMINTACGRSVRLMLQNELGWGDERMMQESERMIKLFAAVEIVQPQIIDRLVQKTIALYGDTPINLEASKRAREKMVAFMVQMTGHPYTGEVDTYD